MKIQIAIISDIHGNIVALEEVLRDIDKRGVSKIYCLGDLVDFAPWGNEVVDLMRERGIPCLLGNHDERIAFDLPITPLKHHDEVETANRLLAINHSKAHIRPDNKAWLGTLPYNLELQYRIADSCVNILLVHASLQSNDEYVYQEEAKVKVLPELKRRGIDVLLMGHTHQSYIESIAGVTLVNCGSVGRSRENDRMATYSMLTITEEGVEAEIIKLHYPIQKVANAIYESDIPDFYADFLLRK